MRPKTHNTQMFALRRPPPKTIELAGYRYVLVRVFKHDFWAATCLYELDSTAGGRTEADTPEGIIPRIVVKFGRVQTFFGLPLAWYASFMRDHEEAIYKAICGVKGVPRWVGRVGQLGYAIEYIQSRPLDHLEAPPPRFFDRLREIFDAVHARGVAYCDANKRSNILVGPCGEPYLVDYQIAFRRRDELPWPVSAIVGALNRYMQGRDIYHLYKHKRRMSPAELSKEEDTLSRSRSRLHRVHRKLTKPYRALRRKFLRRQYEKGRLVSPTADLEDHYQPEQATWKKEPHK